MDPVEIIGFPQSDFVWTTRIAAAEKGVPHVNTPLSPQQVAEAGLHPLGKVPVLRHGDVVLGESRAICGYLDAAFDGPALLPRDPRAAALAEQWTSIVVTAVEPLVVRQYLFAYLFPGTADGSPDRARIEAALPALHRQLGVLDAALAEGFLGGAAFTLADAYLTPILHYLRGAPEGAAAIAGSRHLAGYLERMLARPAVAETLPPPLPR